MFLITFQKCSKQWTSMKGAITFVVILSHQTTPIQEIKVPIGQMTDRNSHNQRLIVTLRPGANVLLELFPQACADCASHNDVRLSPPKWYPEEVDKVSDIIGYISSNFLQSIAVDF